MEKLNQKDWERIWKLVALSESAETEEAQAATAGIFRILKARGVTLRELLATYHREPKKEQPPHKQGKSASNGFTKEDFDQMLWGAMQGWKRG